MLRSRFRIWFIPAGVTSAVILLLVASHIFSQRELAAAPDSDFKPGPSRPSQGTTAAAPRLDAWRVLGPGGGGAQFHHSISPLDPKLMLVSSDMSGNYISRDGGNTWRMFNLRRQATAFAFDPSNARVIYAVAGAIWRSEDSGDTWNVVYPALSSINGLRVADDEGISLITTIQGPVRVSGLAVDPDNASILYASMANVIMSSADRGATWKALGKIASGATLGIFIDPYTPRNDRTVLIVT
jgi:hypothetical protein